MNAATATNVATGQPGRAPHAQHGSVRERGFRCPFFSNLIHKDAVKRDPPPSADRLKGWRKRTHLPRREAVAVLQRYGCLMTASTLSGGEAGKNPREWMTR